MSRDDRNGEPANLAAAAKTPVDQHQETEITTDPER